MKPDGGVRRERAGEIRHNMARYVGGPPRKRTPSLGCKCSALGWRPREKRRCQKVGCIRCAEERSGSLYYEASGWIWNGGRKATPLPAAVLPRLALTLT